MQAVPDDPGRLQAMIFVHEFEAIADTLVAELDDRTIDPPRRRQLIAELHEVRRQVADLQRTYRLAPSRPSSV
ncbi:hypothetical protein ACWDTI_19075 [Gordonia sp. NPDC003424]